MALATRLPESAAVLGVILFGATIPQSKDLSAEQRAFGCKCCAWTARRRPANDNLCLGSSQGKEILHQNPFDRAAFRRRPQRALSPENKT